MQIMKSYESSTATLRALLGHPALQRESIEATMDALAEVNADAKEVDEAVRIGGDIATGAGGDMDERELEDELGRLIEEEKSVVGKLEGKEMEVPKEDLRVELGEAWVGVLVGT